MVETGAQCVLSKYVIGYYFHSLLTKVMFFFDRFSKIEEKHMNLVYKHLQFS